MRPILMRCAWAVCRPAALFAARPAAPPACRATQNKKARMRGPSVLAEQVGFEPTVRHNRTPDFESGAFDHSATAPDSVSRGAKAAILAESPRLRAAARRHRPCTDAGLRAHPRRHLHAGSSPGP